MKKTKNKIIKLTGNNSIVKFSNDGTLVAIGAYDGGVKVANVDSEKIIFKTKIKGPRRDVLIHHIGISFDNKYCAFSSLGKVYIVDLPSKSIIKEIGYHVTLERQMTVPFCFYNQSNRLVIPNGEELMLYTIDEDETIVLPLFEGAGTTEQVQTSWKDDYLAYKTTNHKFCDQLFIYDLNKKTLRNKIDLPYEYVPGKQMYSCRFRFVENDAIAVLRQSYGLSIFDIQTTKEIKGITWDRMGFRSLSSILYRISRNGRYLLINKETSTNGADNLVEWTTSAESCEYVVYDTERLEIIYSIKNGSRYADFNIKKNLIAIQHYDWEQDSRNRQTVKIFEIIKA